MDGKNILITGGTGSFGRAFLKRLLQDFNLNRVVILSRDEMKQWEMHQEYINDDRVRFFIGDVRDPDRLNLAMRDIDYVVHAAALKIVPTAEYNPFECIKTNINGAMNIIDAAMQAGVKKLVALSTDKASSPINLYGATKLCSDKLFVAANNYSGERGCSFSVVRYGNVMGSRGSVIPFFLNLEPSQKTPITHTQMTRFMITLDQGIDLVMKAFETMEGGEIFVKKIPSMRVVDIADALRPGVPVEIVGIRPGEKVHEQMIGEEDARTTYEYSGYFKILPNFNGWANDPRRIAEGKLVKEGFIYSSDTNDDWMTKEDLIAWVFGVNKLINCRVSC